jgi:ABC-type Zn uptake system ZnuABC Zn-binding protein ZnuA
MFRSAIVGLFIIIFLLSNTAGLSAQESELTVITTTSILADVAGRVAGDAAHVESLFPLGANAHTAEPSAQDVVRLSDADLVLVVGASYEEGLLPVLEEAGGENVIPVSLCVPIRSISQDSHEVHTNQTDTDAAAQCSTHYEAVNTAFGLDDVAMPDALGPLYALECAGHDHHDGEDKHEGCDPHVWTDPVNVALWALMIRDVLSEHDPANAATYAANTDAYLAELADTNEQVASILSTIPDDNRFLVTNHLTLGYFAARYDLTIVGVVIPGGSTTSEPSTQDVLKLIDTIQEVGVPAIFTENVVSDSLVQQIADETGAEIISLYTESLSQPGEEADTYLNYFLLNASAIASALE